jgi:hypothetical protein
MTTSKYITLEALMEQIDPKFMIAIGQCSVKCIELQPYTGVSGFTAALMTLDAMGLMKIEQDGSLIWERAEEKLKAKEAFVELHSQTKKMGLTASAATAKRIVDTFDAPRMSATSPRMLSDEICKRLKDEMQGRLLYSIGLDKQALVTDSDLFGKQVTVAFPSATFDIEEAGKCLAFERWTACVYHLMRVMEIGLRALRDRLNLSPTTNRNWEAVLTKCDLELRKSVAQRSPEWVADDPFFSNATAILRAVKDAWRNPTMHVEKVYTEEQAEDIWNAVKGFTRHLGTKLKE